MSQIVFGSLARAITVLSLLFLFQFFWMVYVMQAITHPEFINGMVPAMVGAIIFVVIGIWMTLSEKNLPVRNRFKLRAQFRTFYIPIVRRMDVGVYHGKYSNDIF